MPMQKDTDLVKIPTKLAGVYELTPKFRARGEGYIMELIDESDLYDCLGVLVSTKRVVKSPLQPWDAKGIHVPPINTGFHKLSHAVTGEIDQYVVDFRTESSTFGEWIKIRLHEHNASWVPAGCGNLIQARENGATLLYFMTVPWKPGLETDVNMRCPYLNIKFDHEPRNLSERDRNAGDTAAHFGSTNAFGRMQRRKQLK
jgi:dTDP-4-dehydrorhamnose 3,5-epimerase